MDACLPIADVDLNTWQGPFLFSMAGLGMVGAGVLMFIAGRSGMRFKDIQPSWRAGYATWIIGGVAAIAMGVFVLLFAVAAAVLRSFGIT